MEIKPLHQNFHIYEEPDGRYTSIALHSNDPEQTCPGEKF